MQQPVTHVIVFSHGFGVRKNARGLFTAITRAVPTAAVVMFDYYPVNQASNTLTAKPLPEQALKLRKMINAARADYPGAVIDLVCHGEGCVVAGLVKPRGIRKVIMVAPNDDVSRAVTVVSKLSVEPAAAVIDVQTRSKLQLHDASIVIHPEYWQGMAGIKPVKLYNQLAKFTALRILAAKQDDELGETLLDGIDRSISLVRLQGDHYFADPEDRSRLLYIMRKELTLPASEAAKQYG